MPKTHLLSAQEQAWLTAGRVLDVNRESIRYTAASLAHVTALANAIYTDLLCDDPDERPEAFTHINADALMHVAAAAAWHLDERLDLALTTLEVAETKEKERGRGLDTETPRSETTRSGRKTETPMDADPAAKRSRPDEG